jgi:cytochrome c-type biogenesis protein CcmH/NrfG
MAAPSVEPDIGGMERKVSYADLEYLYEQKRLETLKQRSRELAKEIDQTTADLQELEQRRTRDENFARASSKASGQPWGNYLFVAVLLLLLTIAGVSL